MNFVAQLLDTLRLLPVGGPGVCSIMLTNACNANCDFCGYARDKTFVTEHTFMDAPKLFEAIDILYDRGVRYISFLGGEPTLHPKLNEIIRYTVKKNMRPAIVTNGSKLTPELLGKLKKSGLKTLYISIDSPNKEEHETNRGLPNVWEKIAKANIECSKLGIKSIAIVTINRLIEHYATLIQSIKDLGFDTVTFSYPKTSLNSTHLSYSDTSSLVNFSPDELIDIFNEIIALKPDFGIQNPRESLVEMIRFLKQEKQKYPCYGGYKYFYLDYYFDLYRCDFWSTKICSVFEFRDKPFVRDECTLCMNSCYRDSSVMLHPAVSVGDAIAYFRKGQFAKATYELSKKTNFQSIRTLIEDRRTLNQLAKLGDLEQ